MDYAALQAGCRPAENQALRAHNEQLEAQVMRLGDELRELKRLIFGSKRERFVGPVGEGQLSLLPGEVLRTTAPIEQQTYQREVIKSAAARPPSRQLLPAHLPRVEVILEPDEDTSGMKKIGEQISEELEYEPAKLFVRRYIGPGYVSEQESFHIAALPNRPIDNHSMTEVLPDLDCSPKS